MVVIIVSDDKMIIMLRAMQIFQLGPPSSFLTSSAPFCQRGHCDDHFGDKRNQRDIMPAMLNMIIRSDEMTMIH